MVVVIGAEGDCAGGRGGCGGGDVVAAVDCRGSEDEGIVGCA